MKVKDSPLYKTLCEAVRKEDHAELLRMLEMVDWQKSSIVGISSSFPTIRGSFVWGTTPQGRDYWRALSDRLRKAGWECW